MPDELNKEEEAPVEIVEDDAALEVTTDKEPEKIVSGTEGAEELKRRLDAETQRANAAEAVARTATEQVGRAAAEVEDSQLREIDTAISVTERNLDVLEAELAQAEEAGDSKAKAKATRAIAKASADLNALEAGKAAREHAKKNPQPQPQFRSDPLEVVVLSLVNWPKSQEWIKAHPEMARDPNKWGATVAASNLALASGLKADTPEYFSHIEATLQANRIMPMPSSTNGNGNGTVQKTAENPMSDASRPVPPAAAPPSRSSGGGGSPSRPGTIRLTREQAEIAELSYPNLVKEKGAAAAHREYAKALVDLKANGKIVN